MSISNSRIKQEMKFKTSPVIMLAALTGLQVTSAGFQDIAKTLRKLARE